MGDKIKKTKRQEDITKQAITCGFVEIPELYSPLKFRSKIGCIYFKRGREYYICDKEGNHIDWLDDEIGRKTMMDEYPDLVENRGDDIRLSIGQRCTCCEMGNIYIKYLKSNIKYGPEQDGWAFDRDVSAVNINYCPFCGTKLFNK